MLVPVLPAACADIEAVLKDVAHHRGLNANKKRRRELVVGGEAMERVFLTVAAHGDASRMMVFE